VLSVIPDIEQTPISAATHPSFQGKSRTRWSTNTKRRCVKNAKVAPDTLLFAGPPYYRWRRVDRRPHAKAPNFCVGPSGVFFLGVIVGFTHVQPEQFEASQPLRQPRG
jgi:hypothetical protein